MTASRELEKVHLLVGSTGPLGGIKRKENMKKLIMLGLVVILGGCVGFGGIITLTQTMESARGQYDKIYKQGLVPAEVEAKAQLAWTSYQKAATTAADALEAYKVTGDKTKYDQAFAAVRIVVLDFVKAITPVIVGTQVTDLNRRANAATRL